MNIVTHIPPEIDASREFAAGNAVFKLTAYTPDGETRDIGMVTTKEDYERKLYTHKYSPVLFLTELPLRIAYLYGCLNLSFRQSRSEEYVFWWRKVGNSEWSKWFTVQMYKDSVYGEPPEIIVT